MSPEAATIIAQGIGSGISAGTSILNQHTNLALAEKQAKFQLDMINAQNQYNRPINQIARYEEAGLNPALIYGNGSSSAGNQSTIAKYERPNIQYADLGPVLGGMAEQVMNMKLKQQELNNLKQENQNKQSENWILMEEAEKRQRENIIQGILSGLEYSSGDTLDPSKRSAILSSPEMRKYNLNLEGMELTNAYKKLQNQLGRYDIATQSKILNVMMPLQAQLLEAQVAGKNMDNEINKVRVKLEKELSELGGTGAANLVLQFLRTVIR